MKHVKSFMLWLFTPFQILMQCIGRQEAEITTQAVGSIIALVKPGDILVSHESGRPTSIFIKGEYDHAVIVSDKITVIEAVGDKIKDGINLGGVREVDLEKWLYQIDKVAVIRPIITKDINERAGHNARKFIGVHYDYQFEYGAEKIYCSELPYLCYRTEYAGFMQSEPDDEILPQRYRDLCATNDFYLVYEFKG